MTRWFLVAVVALVASPVAAELPPSVADDTYADVANGIPTPRDDTSHAGICDAINLLLGFGPDDDGYLEVNADADPYWVENDAIWRDVEGTVALVAANAHNQNQLGVYTDVGAGERRRLVLSLPPKSYGFRGRGSRMFPFEAAELGLEPYESFGWVLQSDRRDPVYSEPLLNANGWDHLLTYHLGPLELVVRDRRSAVRVVRFSNAFLLAWEDGRWRDGRLGDEDYDDMLYVIGEVQNMANVVSP